MKTLLILSSMFLLAGCGSEPLELPNDNVSADVAFNDAGTFISSDREPSGWEVKTTSGVFKTYTSLRVMVDTPCYVKRYRDPRSKLIVGRILVADKEELLLRNSEPTR